MDCEDWVEEERHYLWGQFGNARISAAKVSDPLNRESWSIDMLAIADRIRSAGELLGKGPTPWQEVVWSCWPFYENVERASLPGEAWEWLDDWLEREGAKPDQWRGWDTSARYALRYRP